MPVNLSAPAVLYTDAWSTNASVASLTGTLTWTVLPAVSVPSIISFTGTLPAIPGSVWAGILDVVGSGTPALYRARIVYYSDSGTQVNHFGGIVPVSGASSLTVVTPPAPPGTTSLRMMLDVADTVAASGRVIQVTAASFTQRATAGEIIGAALARPLRREALDVASSADYVFVSGTPGKLQGSITYLCATFDEALTLDALHQQSRVVSLNTNGGALHGLKYRAVGQTRLTAERAVPGVPARWLVQADIREAA